MSESESNQNISKKNFSTNLDKTVGVRYNIKMHNLRTQTKKRFQFSTVETGLIASAYDITGVIAVLPITWFLCRAHKGQLIGFSFILVGVGCFIYTLPHFISSPYEGYELIEGVQCRECKTPLRNFDDDEYFQYYKYFIIGQVINAIGSQALVTVGVCYIDQNLSQKGAPRAVGCFQAALEWLDKLVYRSRSFVIKNVIVFLLKYLSHYFNF